VGCFYVKEVTIMKPTKISVLISKKVTIGFDSFSVSYGVSADLNPGEDFHMEMRNLSRQVKALVNEGLVSEKKLYVVK